MANEVAILGESGTMAIQAKPLLTGTDELQFRSGSFRGSVDERRVCGVFMVIPATGKELELRFEFTDPGFATLNRKGVANQVVPDPTVKPYTEPKHVRSENEGR